jgi:hypothetical protein
VVKLLVGLIKGAVIGAAIGFGAYELKLNANFESPWLTYGLIGALVGLICGKPIWALFKDKNQTNIIAGLKAAFGFGVGCGLYALLAKAWNPAALDVSGFNVFTWPVSVGGAIGGVYGGFVELDDSIGGDAAPAGKKSQPATKKKLPVATDDE